MPRKLVAFLFLCIMFAQVGPVSYLVYSAQLASAPTPSWRIDFQADFIRLNFEKGIVQGTYSILIERDLAVFNSSDFPLVRFLSSFGSNDDVGLYMTRDASQPNETRYFHYVDSGITEDINLTSSTFWYPWDKYVAGLAILVNETVDESRLVSSFRIPDSSDFKDSWSISSEFRTMPIANFQSPSDSIDSAYVASLAATWNYSSAITLKITFQRLSITDVVYLWILGLFILVCAIALWLAYLHLKKANFAFVTVAVALAASSVPLLLTFQNQNPPNITFLQMILISNPIVAILSAICFLVLAQKHSDVSNFEHMKILRDQVIEPWIAMLKGQDGDVAITAGRIEVEGSTIGRLFLNDGFHIESSKDLETRYSKEFIQHLKTGYGKSYKQWMSLREDWINHLKLVKRRIETIQKDYAEKITQLTNLHDSPARISSELPADLYFDSSRLAYLIYQVIRSNVKQDSGNRMRECRMIRNPGSSDMYHVSRAPFSYLAQGSQQDCESIVALTNEFVNVSKHENWMKRHEKMAQKLCNDFASFLDFLENLSKSIENKKMLKGRCELCS